MPLAQPRRDEEDEGQALPASVDQSRLMPMGVEPPRVIPPRVEPHEPNGSATVLPFASPRSIADALNPKDINEDPTEPIEPLRFAPKIPENWTVVTIESYPQIDAKVQARQEAIRQFEMAAGLTILTLPGIDNLSIHKNEAIYQKASPEARAAMLEMLQKFLNGLAGNKQFAQGDARISVATTN